MELQELFNLQLPPQEKRLDPRRASTWAQLSRHRLLAVGTYTVLQGWFLQLVIFEDGQGELWVIPEDREDRLCLEFDSLDELELFSLKGSGEQPLIKRLALEEQLEKLPDPEVDSDSIAQPGGLYLMGDGNNFLSIMRAQKVVVDEDGESYVGRFNRHSPDSIYLSLPLRRLEDNS